MKGGATMKRLLLCVLCLLPVCAAEASAQRVKLKDVKLKEKRFEPAAGREAEEYAGLYVGVEGEHVVVVRAGRDGGLEVALREGERQAALTDIRLDGAVLTGTKVYEDGTRAEFTATFAERVLNGERAFGLVVDGVNLNLDGLSHVRMFYRRAE